MDYLHVQADKPWYNNNIVYLSRLFTKNLTLCLLGNYSCFLSSAFYFLIFKIILKKNLSEIQSESQTVRTQIRLDILLGLIWVKTACKHYQQGTQEGKELSAIAFCAIPICKRKTRFRSCHEVISFNHAQLN